MNDDDDFQDDVTPEEPKKNSRSRGIYYHKNIPHYGGSSPAMYYGKGAYGATPYGATPYYGGNVGGGDDEDSLVGAVTIGRMIRVCTQSWVTILVFIVVGFVISTVVYKMLPVIYQAQCTIEMMVRAKPILEPTGRFVGEAGTGPISEIFTTRLARLRSRDMLESVIRRYRTDHPSSTIENEVLAAALGGSKMELVRQSRLITISVRSTDPQLAADLVNAYALAAETFSYDQNKADSESAVAWLKTAEESSKRTLLEQDAALLKYRSDNGLAGLESRVEMTKAEISRINADILALRSSAVQHMELLKTLEAVQSAPEKFSSLPDAIPRAGEIATTFTSLQKVDTELKTMLTRLTVNHPDVKVKEKEKEIYKEQFADSLGRARETAAANLALSKSQIIPLEDNLKEKMEELTRNEQAIITCQMHIEQLERARTVESENHRMLLQRMGEARLATDENTTTIQRVEPATVPTGPVSPNPFLIFPAGPFLGIIFGMLFVLIIDHLEDKIVGIADVEQRLRLKVLTVLPHVRRKKREQLALLAHDDKFSHFVEGISGLRNLLDSPRYMDMSRVVLCMSTQPGEGKTITSCNLATVCASSGQRTLLVDFDLRRPRLANIFQKSSKDYQSLSHTLAKNDKSLFASLPVNVGFGTLDVIFSKASSEISPSSLMGTGVIYDFFEWARANYDRVVIDSPPFGIVSDVMVLANLCDSVMLMCCPDRTRFRPIKFAVRSLTEAGARIIGVVVNDVDFGRTSTFSQYDYHYRYSYRYANRYGSYGYSRKAIQAQETAEAAADATALPEGGRRSSRSRSDTVDASLLSDDDE